jgi:hypothetical protein
MTPIAKKKWLGHQQRIESGKKKKEEKYLELFWCPKTDMTV